MPKFPGGYSAKTTPVDNDKVLIADSAASDAIKAVTIVNLVKNRIVTILQTVVSWITTAMINDAAVTNAKWRNGVAFAAYCTTTFTHTTTASKMTLNAEDYDIGGNFDTSTSRFTAPVSGLYRFTGGVAFPLATTSGCVVSIYKNGVSVRTVLNRQWSSAGGWVISEQGIGNVQLAAGDYIELYELVTPAATGQAITTRLEGELITQI